MFSRLKEYLSRLFSKFKGVFQFLEPILTSLSSLLWEPTHVDYRRCDEQIKDSEQSVTN